jgi:pSer/pThr/pTyr-binding forkhead associated (FHA) protein
MLRGPHPGQVYELGDAVVRIGRGHRNHIIIHDNEVSREHCVLSRVNGDYELKDLNSSNGTFVNGQRVSDEGWLLKSNCIIEIGDSITLEFQGDHAPEEEAVRPASFGHPYLVVKIKSQKDAEVYPLDGDSVTIGRELTNDIVIQEPEVSRQHLSLTLSERGYLLEDLHSTNGTMLNGERLTGPVVLRLNDVVQIGTMVQILYTDDPSSFVTTAKTEILPTAENVETAQRKLIDTAGILNKLKRHTDTSDLGMGFAPGSLAGHIFLAYARSEWAPVVAEMYASLEDRRLQVWVDQYLNRGLADWETALDHVLAECRILVIVVSKAALETDYVRRAWRYFSGREKPIILVMYEQVPQLPMELRNLPTVLYNRTAPWETYDNLVGEIMRLTHEG